MTGVTNQADSTGLVLPMSYQSVVVETPPRCSGAPPPISSNGKWSVLSSLHSSDILNGSLTEYPLSIQVRKIPLLLFVTTMVAFLAVLSSILAVGIGVHTIEDNLSDEELDAIVSRYNFYSGIVASITGRTFELCVAMFLPVVILILATVPTLTRHDSWQWKTVVLLVHGAVGIALTIPLSCLSVRRQPPVIVPAVVASDLAATFNASSNVSRDPFSPQPTTETILRTVFSPPFTPSASDTCDNDRGQAQNVRMTHSFFPHPWLEGLLPNGMTSSRSLRVNINSTTLTEQPPPNHTLPFPMFTATNLLLNSMLVSEVYLPWMSISGLDNGSYDQFLEKATAIQTSRNSSVTAFLEAARVMLNESLTFQAQRLHYAVDEVSFNLTHFDLSNDIVFDAVTIEIPCAEKSIARRIKVESGKLKLDTTSQEVNASTTNNMSAIYDLSVNDECGEMACLIRDPNPTNINNPSVENMWDVQPQIHAFASCIFPDGTENVTPVYLHGAGCTRQSNTSMLIYSFARRLVADDMVLEPKGPIPGIRRASVTNLRRYHTITVGRLEWKSRDISLEFNATCQVERHCNGLSYRLNDDASSSRQHVVVGKKYIPVDTLSAFFSRSTPLVTVTTGDVKGELIFQRNVKRRIDWENIERTCSNNVDAIAKRIEGNHWYMEYGLQEAYTAGLFYLFQNAVLRKEMKRADNVGTLNFEGGTMQIRLLATIPIEAAIVCISTCLIMLLSAFFVVIAGKRKEQELQRFIDIHQIARVLLVDQNFPKEFLRCTIYDVEDCWVGNPLSHYYIEAMRLRRRTPSEAQPSQPDNRIIASCRSEV